MRKRTLPPTRQILYNFGVEYPFPPVGIVGAADGKNRRAFLCLLGCPPASALTGFRCFLDRLS